MAVRRFAEVALMIRSDVGVTDFRALALDTVHAPEARRDVLTTRFEALFTHCDAFGFLAIT